jgi:hypothetical protein
MVAFYIVLELLTQSNVALTFYTTPIEYSIKASLFLVLVFSFLFLRS